MHMDVADAAIATTIGNIVSFLIVFQYLFHTKSFQLKASDFVPDLPVIGQIGKLGFSSFLTQLSIVIITIVSMNMLAKYGAQSKYGANDPQAIIGMVMKVFTIAVNLAVGISAGCQHSQRQPVPFRSLAVAQTVFRVFFITLSHIGVRSS